MVIILGWSFFQMHEWVQWQRLTGQLPQKNKTQTLKDQAENTSVISKLSHRIIKQISKLINTDVQDINPEAKSVDTVTCPTAYHRDILYRSEMDDLGRDTCDSAIAWVPGKDYYKGMTVENKEDAKFGKIDKILLVNVCDKWECFFVVKELKIVRYDFGGIFATQLDNNFVHKHIVHVSSCSA